jgi:hypothetical protein
MNKNFKSEESEWKSWAKMKYIRLLQVWRLGRVQKCRAPIKRIEKELQMQAS